MLPDGCLGQLMSAHTWHTVSDFNDGQTGNLNIVSAHYLGPIDGQWLFTGLAAAPYDQLCVCCLKADCQPHQCTKDVQEQVFVLLPGDMLTEEQCLSVDQLSVRGIICLGTVQQTLRLDGSLSDATKVMCELSKVMSFDLPNFHGGPPSASVGAQVLASDVHSSGPRVNSPDPDFDVQRAELSPGLPNLRASAASGMTVDSDSVLGPCVRAFHDVVGDCCLFHVDLALSCVCVRPHPVHIQAAGSPWILAELFSGSFAGWKQASTVMDSLGATWTSTHAVEIDRDLAALYQRNHHVLRSFDEYDPCFRGPGPVVAPDDFRSSIFVGDVRTMNWVKILPWNSELVVSMSPPCPPWSPSSPKNGLEHEDGQLFPEVVAQLRYLQPRAVAIENVTVELWNILTSEPSLTSFVGLDSNLLGARFLTFDKLPL